MNSRAIPMRAFMTALAGGLCAAALAIAFLSLVAGSSVLAGMPAGAGAGTFVLLSVYMLLRERGQEKSAHLKRPSAHGERPSALSERPVLRVIPRREEASAEGDKLGRVDSKNEKAARAGSARERAAMRWCAPGTAQAQGNEAPCWVEPRAGGVAASSAAELAEEEMLEQSGVRVIRRPG